MLLAFDVGNTNIVCGVYKDRKLIRHWRVATDTLQTADGYAALLGNLFQLTGLSFKEVEDIIISTVVPPIIPILETMSQRYFHTKPILVGPGIKTGLNILYDNPKELGADRIVNAVAAVDEYKCPLIIIDMGTATTVTAVDADGAFRGGAILPGANLSLAALYGNTALLPDIPLSVPDKAIGTNTVSCMQSGCILGAALLLDGMIDRMEAELGQKTTVVATGGIAPFITPACKHPMSPAGDLILRGLAVLYEQNK